MTLQRSDIYTNIPKTAFREKSRFCIIWKSKKETEISLSDTTWFAPWTTVFQRFNAYHMSTSIRIHEIYKQMQGIGKCAKSIQSCPSLLLTSRCTNGVKKGTRSSYSTRKQLWHCNKHSIAQFKSSFSFSKQHGNLYHKKTLPPQ